ncbi:GGDEF domain-containing protein [Sphingomonas sp. R86521]|uniref:GGDEF domain-containing protein n=1 Tax=Sphingomonas sp. R86521 TaxID=3093860 RepID=UPI0036D31A07
MPIFGWRKSVEQRPTAEEIQKLLLRDFENERADWLWEIDTARRVVHANARFASACGAEPQALDGEPLLKILAGDGWETGEFSAGLRTLADKLKKRENFTDLRLAVMVDRAERWWQLSAALRYDETGAFAGFLGVGSDVTEQRASADRINRQARFDDVTGLPNRLFVTETMNRAVDAAARSGGRTAVRIIAITSLGDLKARFGYSKVNAMLATVAVRLTELADDHTMVGQVGPGEFAIVWQNADGDTEGTVDQASIRFDEAILTGRDLTAPDTFALAAGLAISDVDAGTGEQLISTALDRAYGLTRDVLAGPSGGPSKPPQVVTATPSNAGPTEVERRSAILTFGPSASAGLGVLLEEIERRHHNKPPETLHEESADRIRVLKRELDDLIRLASDGKPVSSKLAYVRYLAQSVFQFSKDTGDIFVAGLKPFIASVPTAIGTMFLIQSICSPAVSGVFAPGAALAILAGYFAMDVKRARTDIKSD